MKNLKMWSVIVLIVIALPLNVSCGDEDEVKPQEKEVVVEPTALEKSLFGTSWKIYKRVYNSKGTYTTTYVDNYSSITFSNQVSSYINLDTKAMYYFYYQGKKYGVWYENKEKRDNYLQISPTEITSYTEIGPWIKAMGGGGYMINHTSDELVLTDRESSDDNYYSVYYYKAASSDGVDEDDNNGDDITIESPHIAYYDFTATKTSVTVEFQVLNDVKITSAKVKYGTTQSTSSTVNATVVAKHFKATISGLKSGTTYYVKGVATGNGKTGESEVIKVMTQY